MKPAFIVRVGRNVEKKTLLTPRSRLRLRHALRHHLAFTLADSTCPCHSYGARSRACLPAMIRAQPLSSRGGKVKVAKLQSSRSCLVRTSSVMSVCEPAGQKILKISDTVHLPLSHPIFSKTGKEPRRSRGSQYRLIAARHPRRRRNVSSLCNNRVSVLPSCGFDQLLWQKMGWIRWIFILWWRVCDF